VVNSKKQNDLESITFTKTFCHILVLLTFYHQMDAKMYLFIKSTSASM